MCLLIRMHMGGPQNLDQAPVFESQTPTVWADTLGALPLSAASSCASATADGTHRGITFKELSHR